MARFLQILDNVDWYCFTSIPFVNYAGSMQVEKFKKLFNKQSVHLREPQGQGSPDGVVVSVMRNKVCPTLRSFFGVHGHSNSGATPQRVRFLEI